MTQLGAAASSYAAAGLFGDVASSIGPPAISSPKRASLSGGVCNLKDP
jgi:hypothetical protein